MSFKAEFFGTESCFFIPLSYHGVDAWGGDDSRGINWLTSLTSAASTLIASYWTQGSLLELTNFEAFDDLL